ncbi:MAG: hypothetical protein FWD67_02130 [Betaproteobacteria bacterium]|nr:hypothetical protein [Betaproteobacteria bacterium]
MLLARIIGVLLCLGIGASLILWMLTGQSRYRAWAWNLLRVGVVAAFIILALFALERVLIAV